MENKYEVKIDKLSSIQTLLIELAYEFHNICEENNLIYSIWFGTMLGAVRHQNIIPWDDDMDFSMPRPDYERFIRIINSGVYPEFRILFHGCKNYPQPFAKFGFTDSILIEHALRDKFSKSMINIDIFPIDGMPVASKEMEDHVRKLGQFRKKRIICARKTYYPHNVLKKVLRLPIVIYQHLMILSKGINHYLNMEVAESLKFRFEDSEMVSCSFDSPYKTIMKKEDYLSRTKYVIGEFEFWGIKDYESHLKVLYGDYMELPPIEKRKPIHNYDSYISQNIAQKRLGMK